MQYLEQNQTSWINHVTIETYMQDITLNVNLRGG